MTQRSKRLQAFLDALVERGGISEGFADSTDHPYSCTCDQCREWWRKMGPEEDGQYGPFGTSLDEPGEAEA